MTHHEYATKLICDFVRDLHDPPHRRFMRRAFGFVLAGIITASLLHGGFSLAEFTGLLAVDSVTTTGDTPSPPADSDALGNLQNQLSLYKAQMQHLDKSELGDEIAELEKLTETAGQMVALIETRDSELQQRKRLEELQRELQGMESSQVSARLPELELELNSCQGKLDRLEQDKTSLNQELCNSMQSFLTSLVPEQVEQTPEVREVVSQDTERISEMSGAALGIASFWQPGYPRWPSAYKHTPQYFGSRAVKTKRLGNTKAKMSSRRYIGARRSFQDLAATSE